MIQDVLKFMLFFSAMFVAVVVGLRNLYSYYNSIQEEMLGQNKSKAENINENFSKLVIIKIFVIDHITTDQIKVTNLILKIKSK